VITNVKILTVQRMTIKPFFLAHFSWAMKDALAPARFGSGK
jgi:hypothetical protein